MEVTIIDEDNDRYDPALVDIKEHADRALLITRHSDSVPFSQGDRVEIILASDTYEDSGPSELVKEREEMTTVAGRCRVELSETTYAWEIAQVSIVEDVFDADPDAQLSIRDFD